MKCLELTEIKELLDEKGIKYVEVRINGSIYVYVNGLIQIREPTQEDRAKFWPDVRISFSEGDAGYYVRACGVIHEDQSIDDVMKHIETWVL